MESSQSPSAENLKIFGLISEIMTDPEFNESLQSFFEKNCHVFEDIEENKLEYKNIYEEFVNISEKVIEAKLKETSGVDDEAF